MAFGMQGKDIRQPCPGYLNVSMGSLKECRALTNISPQPMAKKSLPQDLGTVMKLLMTITCHK